jgi:hypothetical protein
MRGAGVLVTHFPLQGAYDAARAPRQNMGRCLPSTLQEKVTRRVLIITTKPSSSMSRNAISIGTYRECAHDALAYK